mmetsp:Transcript_34836/g.58971  ORF Transcript_34836/g.58971 Transcript_34836/m.58971 type:complete len:90 (+) Transcript_34836:117-386(+)
MHSTTGSSITLFNRSNEMAFFLSSQSDNSSSLCFAFTFLGCLAVWRGSGRVSTPDDPPSWHCFALPVHSSTHSCHFLVGFFLAEENWKR